VPIDRALSVGTTLALVGSFAFSLVALRGYWDAPFGDVLRPLPVAFGGFLAATIPTALGVDVPLRYRVVVACAAVLAAFVAAVEGVVLLAGWRRV
jgi:hypothetical protein